MAILDFLKAKWSPGAITEEDRQRLFWYLKRKTSYTAWKREGDRFARFVSIVEKQVKEEPSFKDKWGDTLKWEPIYVEALKGLVHYEKGLERLKRGDRTVWLYNSLGELRDAMSVNSGRGGLYGEIVQGGPDYEPDKYRGKYVNDMKAALQWHFEASEDTGYLQPRMANRSASEVWYPERHKHLQALPCKQPLDGVPTATDITVRTGDPVPVFGIYEPQVKEGCLNYLLQSEPARSYSAVPVDYNGMAVTWRLIWQDHRYEGGAVPEEETSYFPDDPAEPPPYVEPELYPPGTLITANTGNLAPRPGRWVAKDDLSGSVQIARKGDVLPQYQGRDVTWVWSSE